MKATAGTSNNRDRRICSRIRFSLITGLYWFIGAILTAGCGGGAGNSVLPDPTPQCAVEIIGSPSLQAGTYADYKVNVSGDQGVGFSWEASEGEFENATEAIATYHPPTLPDGSYDTTVNLRVMVETILNGSLEATMVVTINEDPPIPCEQLSVGGILSEKTEMVDCELMTFGVLAEGDEGITYYWSVEPSDAGNFSRTDLSCPLFTPSMVSEARDATIVVEVNSDNCGPYIKSMNINISPCGPGPEPLIVGVITGPASVDENCSGNFFVTIGGAAGPVDFQWEVIDGEFGVFDGQGEASTNYSAVDRNPILVHTPWDYDSDYRQTGVEPPRFYDPALVTPDTVTIKVTVSDGVNLPEERTKQISLINEDPYIGWVNFQTEIEEHAEVSFSIEELNPPGPIISTESHYAWVVDPPNAGTFTFKSEVYDENGHVDYYFVTHGIGPEVMFKAAEVDEDLDARIAVFYVYVNDESILYDDEWILMDSTPITVLNNYYIENVGISGPPEVVESFEYYFKLFDADPAWTFNDITWDWEVIQSEPGNGCQYTGPWPIPNDYVTITPTVNENGDLTREIVKLCVPEITIDNCILLTAYYPGGSAEYQIAARTNPISCIEVIGIYGANYSGYDQVPPGPFPPVTPDVPSEPPQMDSVPPGMYEFPFQFPQDNIYRLYVIIHSYLPNDLLEITWKCSPPTHEESNCEINGDETVHFWGDDIYEYPFEELWDAPSSAFVPTKYAVPEDMSHGGSHYYLDGGSQDTVAWVEVTSHVNEPFSISVTVKPEFCEPEMKTIQFNGS